MSAREAMFGLKMKVAKRSARHMYEQLLANERMPVEQLRTLTERRAADAACYAFEHSSFYRDLYSGAGFSRDDLRDPQAFSSLPVIDRAMVKGNVDRIRPASVEFKGARPQLTGGSTGEPLQTWSDPNVPLQPLSWRMYRWWGVSPADDTVHIGRWAASSRQKMAAVVSWWPTRVDLIDASKLDEETICGLVESVNKHHPPLVEGYVGALNEIARYVAANGLTFCPPRALGVTAAPLTAEVRAFIEKTLGAPVHDQYRCSEVPWMAGECGRRDGLHIFADVRRIDVVDHNSVAQPAGVTGDLIVTDLVNRVFPLIRYRLGDRGALRRRACPCGVSLPLMDAPDGRTVDMIRLPDGTIVAGGLFSIFSAVPTAVRQFQLHQNRDHSIDLTVVLGEVPGALADAQTAAANLRERLGRQVEVRLRPVADLPYSGGKLKYVTSDVPSPS